MGRDGILGLALGAVFLLTAFFTLQRVAVAIGDATNTSYGTDTFTPMNGSIDATAGYIYEYNLSTTEKSYRWVGLWGNVSGSVQLQDGTNTFYSWAVSTVTAGSILYALTDATGIDPTDFGLFNSTYLSQTDTAYGYLDSVSDSVTNTYTGASSFDSPSRQTNIDVNSTSVGSWTNYVIRADGTDYEIGSTNEVVWAVSINPAQSAFDGGLADYELLIPENEEAGDGEGTATSYYLWIELN